MQIILSDHFIIQLLTIMNIKTTELALLWVMPSITFLAIASLVAYQIGTDFNNHWIVESVAFFIVFVLLQTLYGLLQTILSEIFFSKANHLSISVDNITSNVTLPTNNTVSTCLDKSILIQNEKRKKAESDKQRRTQILVEYANVVLSNHMNKNHLETILKNVELFTTSPEVDFISAETDGSLGTANLRHFAWNIGKRLGYDRMTQAKFIKQCFPKEFMNCELPTIIRNLSDEVASIIKIDKPDKGSYNFHWEAIGLPNPLDITSKKLSKEAV